MSKILLIVSLFLCAIMKTLAQGIERDEVGSGRAMLFDEGNDYIDLGNVFDDIDFPFTISAWIKMDPSNVVGPIFVTQDNAPLYNGFWLVISQSGISFEFGDGDGENNPAFRKGLIHNISGLSGRWINIAGVMRSESDMDMYINGLRQPAFSSGESQLTMDSDFPETMPRSGRGPVTGLLNFSKG
jgi:hypothetical protein